MVGLRMGVMRKMPYPPSFKSTAARTIEPAIGASTWAFGSHRWVPYIGILTRNAVIQASHRIVGGLEVCVRWDMVSVSIFEWPYCACNTRMATSSGRELAIV